MKRTSRKEETASRLLRAHNLRATESRVHVLAVLMSTHEPLSIDMIAVRCPHVHVVTLYRMLAQLVRAGIVYQADLRGGKAFFEYQPTHHHHITCTTCGTLEAVDTCATSAQQQVVAQTKKFARVESHVLEFFGICNACAR